MDHSKKDATLEACAGALQNLTASRGLVSTPLSTRGQRCQHLAAVRRRNVLLQHQGSIAGLCTVDGAAQALINAKDQSLLRLKSAPQGCAPQVCVPFQELLQVSVPEGSVRRKEADCIAGSV